MEKTLIVYYSQSRGNTKRIAQMIQKKLNADMEAIEIVTPYSGSYDDIIDQGKNEIDRGFLPQIKPLQANINDYDRIYIGTPTWWYTMAPAVTSFLSKNGFVGKRVILFMTHGGWPGHTIKDMKKACKDAVIIGEKEIQFDSTGGDHLETPVKEIEDWIETI